MKKRVLIFLLVIFAFTVLSVSDNAYALFSFDEIKMVGADLSVIEQNEFDLNETPWLYLKLPESPFGGSFGDLNITFSFWHDPDDNTYFESGGISANRENWISLPDWDSIKAIGDWNVD